MYNLLVFYKNHFQHLQQRCTVQSTEESITPLFMKSGKMGIFQNKDWKSIKTILENPKHNKLNTYSFVHCELTQQYLNKIITIAKNNNKNKDIKIFICSNNKKLRLPKLNKFVQLVLSSRNAVFLTKEAVSIFTNEKLLNQFKKLSVDTIEIMQMTFGNTPGVQESGEGDIIMKAILDEKDSNDWFHKPNIVFHQCVIKQFKVFQSLFDKIKNKEGFGEENTIEFIDTIGLPKTHDVKWVFLEQQSTKPLVIQQDRLKNKFLFQKLQDLNKLLQQKSYRQIIFDSIEFDKLRANKHISDSQIKQYLHNIVLQADTSITFVNCRLDDTITNILTCVVNNNPDVVINFARQNQATSLQVKQQIFNIKEIQDRKRSLLNPDMEKMLTQIFSQTSSVSPFTSSTNSNVSNNSNDKYSRAINQMQNKDAHNLKQKTQELYNNYKSMSDQASDKAICKKKLDAITSLPQLSWKEFHFNTKQDSLVLFDQLESNIKTIFDRYLVGNTMLKKKIINSIINGLKTGEFKWIVLVGPPGIGKTSFLIALAAAFAYIDLWYESIIVKKNTTSPVITDEYLKQLDSEKDNYLGWIKMSSVTSKEQLEGHREVYAGSAPGMIFQALCKDSADQKKRHFRVVGIDELDKANKDSRGDVVSQAFLDKADTNGKNFSDKYIGDNFKFNLKKAFFVATANELSSIPATLQDRMEKIIVSGYSEEEKVQIVLQKTLPDTLKKFHVAPDKITFSPKAVEKLVQTSGNNTKLSLRELEGDVQHIVEKAIKDYSRSKNKTPISITEHNLDKYLPDNNNKLLENEYLIGSEAGVVNIFIMDNEGQMSPARITAAKVSKEYSASYGQYEILGIYEGDRSYNSRDLKTAIQNTLTTAIPGAIAETNKFLSALSILKHNFFTIQLHGKYSVKAEEEGLISLGIGLAILSLINEKPLRQNVYCYGYLDNRGKIVSGNKVDFASRIKNALNTLHKYDSKSKLTVVFPLYNRGKTDTKLKENIQKSLEKENINMNFIDIKFADNIIEAFLASIVEHRPNSKKSSQIDQLV